MAKSKYIGKIYDGRWEVIGQQKYRGNTTSRKFILRNIYNDMEITLKDVTLRKIDRGETTVSKSLSVKIENKKGNKRWN